MSFIPNAELVARAWLIAAVDGLTAGKVATTLPDPPWEDDEFVQIMSVGGSPDRDNPIYQPVVSINSFARKDGSLKPPWGKANQLAEKIRLATYVRRWQTSTAVELAMPTGYGRALLLSVYPVSEPRRIPSDPSQYAVYSQDVQFVWTPASEVIT